MRLARFSALSCALACAGLFACEQNKDPVTHFSDTDAEMIAATEKARRTTPLFIKFLQAPQRGQKYFTVKKAFPAASGGREHIWVADVRLENGVFHGRVENIPADVPGLKLGDPASVPVGEITDWMFLQNGEIEGGFTSRVEWARATPQERKARYPNIRFRPEPAMP